ncbi:MAG: hypothetical protein ACREM1_10585, partial [Longimicrobiales bacterium]
QGAIFTPVVLATTDWGESWHASIPTFDGNVHEMPVYALALDPANPGRLWAGVAGGVMWSDNGAAEGLDSWSYQVGPPRGAVVELEVLDRRLYAATVQNVEIFFEDDGSVRETSDLGLYRHASGLRWDSLVVPPNTPGASHAVVDETTGTLFIGHALRRVENRSLRRTGG